MAQGPQLVHDEVQQGSPDGDRPVELHRHGDFLFGDLAQLLLLLDIGARNLGLLQAFDQLNVVQNVALRIAEAEEQVVLQLLELDVEPVLVLDELGLLRAEVGSLLVHDKGQKLLLQAVQSDHEVEQRSLRRDLRLVVGVAQLCLQVELEVVVILDLLVP